MKPSLWIRVDALARQLTPLLLSLLLTLMAVVPLQMPALGAVAPVWPLMAVFYWSLYRPDLMPVIGVFSVGLLYDALSGAPIGVNTAVLVVVHGLVLAQRRFFYGKPFAIIWLGFALVSACALVAVWLLSCAWYGRLLMPEATVFQYLVTLGLFAPLAWLLLLWQRSFLREV